MTEIVGGLSSREVIAAYFEQLASVSFDEGNQGLAIDANGFRESARLIDLVASGNLDMAKLYFMLFREEGMSTLMVPDLRRYQDQNTKIEDEEVLRMRWKWEAAVFGPIYRRFQISHKEYGLRQVILRNLMRTGNEGLDLGELAWLVRAEENRFCSDEIQEHVVRHIGELRQEGWVQERDNDRFAILPIYRDVFDKHVGLKPLSSDEERILTVQERELLQRNISGDLEGRNKMSLLLAKYRNL